MSDLITVQGVVIHADVYKRQMPDSAMMECINIIHQGGVAALKRILAKTVKPYTCLLYTSRCV